MEYKISKNEINRRKKAYITLSTSLIFGLILSSIFIHLPILIIGYTLVVSIISLVGIGVFSFRFFSYLSKTIIALNDKYLVRMRGSFVENYLLKQISHVKIKWTTNNTIREIYIWLVGGESIFITGLDRFEQFREDLLSKIYKDVAVKEIREFLDFDHPLFYSVLGLVVSCIGILSMKFVANFNYRSMNTLLLVLFAYLFILGIYFVTARPISKRLSNGKKIIDYAFGLIMICIGACIFIFTVNSYSHF
jgi:hypothetical protein